MLQLRLLLKIPRGAATEAWFSQTKKDFFFKKKESAQMESHDKGGLQVTFLTPVRGERQSEGLLAASGQRRTALLGSTEGCTIRECVRRRPESFLELESCLEIHIETQVAGIKPGVLFPLVRKFPSVLSS